MKTFEVKTSYNFLLSLLCELLTIPRTKLCYCSMSRYHIRVTNAQNSPHHFTLRAGDTFSTEGGQIERGWTPPKRRSRVYYEHRAVKVEHVTFVPLVFSTTGGMERQLYLPEQTVLDLRTSTAVTKPETVPTWTHLSVHTGIPASVT